MTGEHIGQPAHFAPAHGIGLAGNAERPGADLVDPPRGEVEIDDRIALVGARGGLVRPWLNSVIIRGWAATLPRVVIVLSGALVRPSVDGAYRLIRV